ncbi:MAG: hypothetical protein LCH81_02230 [Bacteroidetes bacterium]|nr:hypothetical protein [Bacteroidota bacterium]
MKMHFLLRFILCLLLCAGITRVALAQNYPLSVVTTMTPPYPLRFSDYEAFQNQVVVSIFRNDVQDSREYRIYLGLVLENTTNGNRLSSRPGVRPAEAIVLPQGQPSLLLTGADVEALQSGLRLSDFDVVGFNPANSSDQVLPEGTYSFCLTAHNFDTPNIPQDQQLSSGEGASCSTFPVTYYLQPQITQPAPCPITVNTDTDPNLPIAWVVSGLPGGSDVQYRLYFYTVPDGTPAQADPLQIINNSALPAQIVDIDDGSNIYLLDVMAGAEPALVPGLRYVFRVQAVSGTLAFQNNGFSDPCLLEVTGDAGGGDAFGFQADYPNGGIIPFKQFPVIVHMSPYSDDYHTFDYSTEFNGGTPNPHEYTGDNNWGATSPVVGQGLQNYPADVARERACYLPVYAAPQGESATPRVLQHGNTYSWNMNGAVTRRNGEVLNGQAFSEDFQYGMPASVLQTPADNARFQVNENITFNWKTGDAPEKLFPTIPDIVRRTGSGGSATTRTFHYGPVDERWVLQIARDEEFTQIVTNATRSEALTLEAFQIDNASEAQAKQALIYKNASSGATPLTFSEGTYWWRVGWLQDPANQNSTFYQTSEVRKFCVGATADCNSTAQNQPGANTPAQTGCLADCTVQAPTDRNSVAQEVENEVVVGKFTMTIRHIEGGNPQNGYHGWGDIAIPFLNNLKIKVSFIAMRVNAEHRAYEGEFSVAKEMEGNPVENLARTAGGWLNYALNGDLPLASEVGLANDFIVQKLPIGWDQAIDGAKVVAVIDDLQFGLTGAELSIKFGYDLPGEFAGHPLIFKADRICIHPGGFQSVFRLYLAEDLIVGDNRPENYRLVFPGTNTAPPANSNQYSFVEFDCAGFKEALLAGKTIFPRTALVPENPANAALIAGEVEGSFSARLTRDAGSYDFIANVTFNHPFQIVGLEGWGFELQNAWIDMSDKRNPAHMGFPQGYELSRLGIESASGPAATDPRLLNTWTGFYAATIAVRMRPEFKDGQAQRIGFQIDTMLIDPSGISASIYARNILDIDDGPQSGGRIQGWRFSISELGLGIVQNTSIRGSMRGKIGLPIFRAGELLDYSMLLTVQVGNQTTASYQFRTNVPANQIMHIDMWDIAEATLDANSAIEFVINSNDVRLEACLFGHISLVGDMTGGGSIPGMDFAGVRYEHLRFGVSSQRGGFYFDTNSYFAAACPQHNTAGFPVKVGTIEPVFQTGEDGNMKLGLRIVNLELTLTSGSSQQLSAKTTIAFYAIVRNFSLDHIDQLSLEWGGVEVSKIGISGDVGGGIRLAGEIEFYSENMPSGGKKDVVRGSANVALPSLGAFNLFVEFGTVKNCTTCPDYNTSNQYYPYFSIDAMVRLSSGITIFPGVAIMGIGGGVWYNMEKLSEGQFASPDELRRLTATDSSAQHGSANRIQFSPKWGTLGFGLRALFGPPSGGVYGLTVKVEAEIDTHHGSLTYISVGGEAYFLPEDQNDPDPADTAPITASCEFRLSNIGNNEFRFTGWLKVKLAYPRSNPVIHGVGPQNELVTATFYADKTMWHFYLGHLNPNGKDEQLNIPMGRAGMIAEIPGLWVEISTYFMVGTPIPTELPPLPEAVEIMLTGANAESRAKLGSQALSGDGRQIPDRRSPDGSGVAFGAHLSLETSLNFAIFYASLKAWAGVDMMLVREPGLLCANGGNGLDSWRAKGQAYVGLDGEMGVGVDIDWLCSRCRIPILRLYAAVAMKAELPNPEYFVGRVGLGYEVLGGMIKGQCNFKMELGEKCHPEAADLGGVTFIGGTSPTRNECRQTQSNVSTFVNPSVSFNVNMQTSQSFIDNDGHNCQVSPKLLHCFLEDANGAQVPIQSSNWNSDRTVYTLVPASELAGYSEFRFVVEIGADKQCDNGGWQQVRSGNSEVVERAKSCFRTGATATNIPDQNVLFSWPLKNQRFFMTQDNGLYSFIKLDKWQSVLNQTSLYDYYFRIKTLDGTPVGGRLPAELAHVPNSPNSPNSIVFAMPPLETQRVYAVQLIRKSKARNNQMPGLGSVKAKFIQQNNTYSSGEYQSSSTVTTRTLPDQVLNEGEKLLYSFYFRTSQYRSMQEKYSTVQLQNPQLASSGDASWLEVEMAMTGEGWEQYDLEGYYHDVTRVVDPLLDLTAPFERFAQKQEVRDKLYTPLMTRFYPSGIFSYYNFVPGSGWVSQYPGSMLYSVQEPSPKVAFKHNTSFLFLALGLPIGEPPLDVDEITAQVNEETLHPRPIQASGAADLPMSNTALVYNLKYETHKIVNEHRSRLMETYQQMLDSKLVNGPSGYMLAGSATDIYNWMEQHHYGSLKGDMNACNAINYFIQDGSRTLESHSADYWSGLFNCKTPAGFDGWDSQGLITGAVQERHRLNEAQFNSLRNSDHANRELLRSIMPPLFQRIPVGNGTYGVRFDFNIPTPGLQNGISVPANTARTEREFHFVALSPLVGLTFNIGSLTFQTGGSNGTFPTPAPTQGSNGTFPVNDPPASPIIYQPVVNYFQFSSFFFNIP